MKKLIIFFIGTSLLITSCDIDDVVNPNVSEESFQASSTAPITWLNGMNRQLALTVNQMVVGAELVSDNYFNNRTLSSKVFDIPQIDDIDLDVRNIQSTIHRLREMADFGINELVPLNPDLSGNIIAEFYFHKGLAHLYSGEYFIALPVTAEGEVASDQVHLNLAVESFNEAINQTDSADNILAYRLALSRAYYDLGDQANAVSEAQQVINTDPLFLRNVVYDGLTDVTNLMQFFLFDSSNDEFAPLPRLDFLDPKYFNLGNPTLEQQPVAILKSEEAYFIIAESQIASQQIDQAKNTLNGLLNEVIMNRPIITIDDSRETRSGGNRSDYPLSSEVSVRFSPEAEPREGFILDRQAGEIASYAVSGTSVTSTQIDAANSEDELLELLYLMRQEVFLAEGRRMFDLGIKFPISDLEALNNANVLPEHLQAQIPDFIPGNSQMDDFTFDEANGIVTMDVNMNNILVNEKNSPFIFPFIN